MGSLISADIDVTKIDMSKLKQDKFYSIVININDTTNEYGNNVSLSENQSKEERDSGVKKKYLGNGRVIWVSDDKRIYLAEKKETKKGIKTNTVGNSGENRDLPF